MKKIAILILMSFWTIQSHSQSKNFIDQPFLETEVEVDTLVIPDKIYLKIVLNEVDSRNKKSTEELEKAMKKVFESLNIDTEKNLSLLDFSSDFKKYFMNGQKVIKSKMYSLLVSDANTAGKVLAGLEMEDISNVSIVKTEYSQSEKLLLILRSKAILKAKQNAENMLEPLNQKVGKAIYISDSNAISNTLQGKIAGVQIRGQSSIYGNRTPDEPLIIDFEKITFTMKVNVKFIIE